MEKIKKTDDEWKKILSLKKFEILRNKGTEPPFSGKYLNNTTEGLYICGACGNPLFSSNTKFNSGSGWPSFYNVIDKDAVELKKDLSLGMNRTEIVCKKCDSHLGHVFSDGSKSTGKRYCINSLSLDFKEE